MSYKIDLSALERDGRSLTQELVRRFSRAIDDGRLAPGEQLPPTRELARLADVNPLTAARVYRRLRELGYLSAVVGRGTFVRQLPPFASDELDDDWQAVALPAAPVGARERLLQDALRLSTRSDVVSLGIGLPSLESLPAADLAASAQAVFAEHGPEAVAYTDVEGLPALRERLGQLGQQQGFAADGEEIVVTTGARQAIDLVARRLGRAVPAGRTAAGPLRRAAPLDGPLDERTRQAVRDEMALTLADATGADREMRQIAAALPPCFEDAMSRLDYATALECVWDLIKYTNRYLEAEAPWNLAKSEETKARLDAVLYNALEAVRIAALFTAPVMPQTSAEVWARLGLGPIDAVTDIADAAVWGGLPAGNRVIKGEPLYPRIYDEGQ